MLSAVSRVRSLAAVLSLLRFLDQFINVVKKIEALNYSLLSSLCPY